jgi:hypothetical protein
MVCIMRMSYSMREMGRVMGIMREMDCVMREWPQDLSNDHAKGLSRKWTAGCIAAEKSGNKRRC